jgi:histidine phosphotransferase ChpT
MSGTHGALRLIELVAARLCHDIDDLVRSLDQALSDATASDPDLRTATLDAARALAVRLEFTRAAWCPDGDALPLARLQHLARGLPHDVAVDVSALDGGTVFSPSTGRIVLNLLLLAANSVPGGGTVILAGAADDLFIRIAGPHAAWPVGLALCLADETEARLALAESPSLQMAMTALLAQAVGIRLSALFPPASQAQPAILRLGG